MKRRLAYLATCLALVAGKPALAGSDIPPALEDIAQIEVLTGWRTDDGAHMSALRIRLAEGWKTYWRAPGDSGIPPSLDLRGSRNIEAVQFHWPVPDVYEEQGVRTIGYKNELVLPMRIIPKDGGADIALNGDLQIGVCQDICVPLQAELTAALPVQPTGSDRAIQRALRQRPDTSKEAGVKSATCNVEPIKDGVRITAELQMPRLGSNEVVVVETADSSVWVSEASSRREGGQLVAQAEMVPTSGKPFLLNRSDIRITVLSSGRGVDIQGCNGS
ncbi:protein-disulfide reductase DsbD family protein [Aliiroseovarius sp. KMU-50]|uniref:Protein-disulfide reductase DsbD family protein n=1 Tax=Aliiroseovarius salicola TaxID=3009082 RepID=A0ABT4W4S5_9RHOB|nr:protein-disulfide reductase DsbD domain-containing protein [Aliiroseovarius sp. KMU-50]MDA5095465.1 protein-disulfide reductase DsbD family protein [Aliiroseovarius sp. KMU-50]